MAKQQFNIFGVITTSVVLFLLGYLFLESTAPHGYPGKAREAEVKQNLHAIQLALERYAVDHEMFGHYLKYPMFIMGGDWTDSYVVWQDWVDSQGLFPADIPKYQVDGAWRAAKPDVGDTLVMEGYMPSYPKNPFKKIKAGGPLQELYHMGFTFDGSPLLRRFVGGADNNAMHEVFGPSRAIYKQSIQGDFFVHHIFNDPPYDVTGDVRKEIGVDWNKPSGNELLVGNFSYCKPREPIPGCPVGENYSRQGRYILAGYGSIKTPGQDVYNRNGNYKGRYRTEPCNFDCARYGLGYSLGISDIPCICLPQDAGIEPNPNQNNGGSDTLPDGVVITLRSGPVYPTSKIEFEETEVK